LLVALILAAGCQSLRLPRSTTMDGSDWPTGGGSAERRHATEHRIPAPLEQTWDYDAQAGFGTSAAALLGETVLVATRQGEVHAIDLASGDDRGSDEFGEAVESAPAVDRRRLYVPVAWEEDPLVAHDLRTGRSHWEVEDAAPVPGSPLLVQDRVVVAHERGALAAYEARTGRCQWRDAPDSAVTVRTSPVRSASRVLVADVAGRLRAVSAKTGERRWTRRLGAPVYETPAAYDDLFFVPTTRGRLLALDARSGRTRWQFRVDSAAAPVRLTSPAIDDSLVVVAGSDGTVRGLHPATGAVRWTFDAHEAVAAPPLLTPEHVFVGTMGAMLFAVDRETGEQVWSHETEGRVRSMMPAGEGRLVVMTEPHEVRLFTSEEAGEDGALARAR
jgi:outer membrane protein assembly factor BamB